MKSSINLLYTKELYQYRLKIQNYFRWGAFILGIVVCTVLFLCFFLILSTSAEKENLEKNKKIALQEDITNSFIYAKIEKIKEKVKVIQTAYSIEPNIENRLKLIKSLISNSGPKENDISIDNIVIDQDNLSATIIVSNGLDSMYYFLDKLEDDSFKKLFLSFELKEVKISDIKGNIQLVINGRFKK